jgi:predicted alpha-1,6-mannanase (GH76 family)
MWRAAIPMVLAFGGLACGAPRAADPLDAAAMIDAAAPALDAPAAMIDAAAPACPDAADRHARADRALAQFLLQFWRADAQYLRAAVPGDNLSAYWVYAQALDSVLDGAERTGGHRFRGLVDALIAGQAAHGWSSDYYDDENWLALALIRAYDLTGNPAYLARAQALLADIESAWDAGSGGIWWDHAHSQKATASNGGPVITAARIAERTGSADALAFARKVYDHWVATMVDPTTHQVADHVTPQGEIVRWRFTYNEGVMIGAALELQRATGEAHFLDDARGYAAFMRASETKATALGPVLSDGDNSGCGGDCQQFKGIGYRYLDALQRADPDPALAALLTASADAAWTLARDPATGHFGTDWTAAPATPAAATISQMSSAVMALELDAARCGPAPDADPPGRYQAEDGAVDHIGLEASAAGFTGWGYLAGWNGDGQRVDLAITTAAAGPHRLTFRYGAGAGDAARAIYVGNTAAAAALAFPSTGGWDHYATVDTTVTLPAGASTLSIRFDAGAGSHAYLNLDHVDVAAQP